MKRIFTTICALALITAGTLPTFAAESPAPPPEPDQGCYGDALHLRDGSARLPLVRESC